MARANRAIASSSWPPMPRWRGDSERAEVIRSRLLELNPHHLLKPYASFADAIRSAEVYGYVLDLRDSYPRAEAERLLASVRGGGPGAENEQFPRAGTGTTVANKLGSSLEEPPIFPLPRTGEVPAPVNPDSPAAAARASRPAARVPSVPELDLPEPAEVFPLPPQHRSGPHQGAAIGRVDVGLQPALRHPLDRSRRFDHVYAVAPVSWSLTLPEPTMEPNNGADLVTLPRRTAPRRQPSASNRCWGKKRSSCLQILITQRRPKRLG